ncbi:hypothetical protein G7Z17_g12551 [Cylindrodendrum hubeiense]|uniref:Uncharacterized protein n=1 Tax=Cylindrodendrum hubeiense TaxID=595255 RepID=A0A9P5H1R6_9HYPO|nr:hypothetical protein G7Z17_g12551 [Cylindrodendrum hubeiense]
MTITTNTIRVHHREALDPTRPLASPHNQPAVSNGGSGPCRVRGQPIRHGSKAKDAAVRWRTGGAWTVSVNMNLDVNLGFDARRITATCWRACRGRANRRRRRDWHRNDGSGLVTWRLQSWWSWCRRLALGTHAQSTHMGEAGHSTSSEVQQRRRSLRHGNTPTTSVKASTHHGSLSEPHGPWHIPGFAPGPANKVTVPDPPYPLVSLASSHPSTARQRPACQSGHAGAKGASVRHRPCWSPSQASRRTPSSSGHEIFTAGCDCGG